jgi:hypothetical protein
MDNIIFDNNIQVVVSQSPTFPADGDTVIFTAQPRILFPTGNRTELENYDFVYTWMVSYDGGLNYQKIGNSNNVLILENINSQQFNNNIYKVKVVLEDLTDFLLTESGDKILNQIGEILLLNNNSTGLSIQDNAISDDTTVSSATNSADSTNTKLEFVNVSSVINEAAVFDNTINEDTSANVKSSQSALSITDSSQIIAGDNRITPTVPDVPNLTIEIPSETLSIQGTCYFKTTKSFSAGTATIKYEDCEAGGPTSWFFSCDDNNPNTQNYQSKAACTSTGACEIVDVHCETPDNMFGALIHNIRYRSEDIAGDDKNKASFCCDSWTKECSRDDDYDYCQENYQKTQIILPRQPGQNSNVRGPRGVYSPPCPDCKLEDYIPNPPFFIANNCTPPGGLLYNTELFNNYPQDTQDGIIRSHCYSRCVGKHEPVSLDVDGTLLSPTIGTITTYATISGTTAAGAAIFLASNGGATIGAAYGGGLAITATTAVITTGGVALLVLGLVGCIYLFTNSAGAGQPSNGTITVSTYCNSSGSYRYPPARVPAEFKKCVKSVCKESWICEGRTDSGSKNYFSRVQKGKGSSLSLSEPQTYANIPVGATFKLGNSIYTKTSNGIATVPFDDIPLGSRFTMDNTEYTKTDNYSYTTVSNPPISSTLFGNPTVSTSIFPDSMTQGVVYPTDRVLSSVDKPFIRDNEAPIFDCDTQGGSIEFEKQDGTCRWIVKKMCCPSGKKCTFTPTQETKDRAKEFNPKIELDASNSVQSSHLFDIFEFGCLDFVMPAQICNTTCSGEGCDIYTEWSILDSNGVSIPCNEDYEIKTKTEIKHDGHGKNGDEIVVATDAKCNSLPNRFSLNRNIQIHKIVKRYTYKDPGQAGSYENIISRINSMAGIGVGTAFVDVFVIKYEEQPKDRDSLDNDSPYLKLEQTIQVGNRKEYLYRHSAIEFTGVVLLSRDCDQCFTAYKVSQPTGRLPYPCNDRDYVIDGCQDENGNALPPHYGECLKDRSDKTTPIRIVKITEVPIDDQIIDKLDLPNGDYYREIGNAKAEGKRRVGSVGIVCADSSPP